MVHAFATMLERDRIFTDPNIGREALCHRLNNTVSYHLSLKTMTAEILRAYSLTPSAVITRWRIAEACRLLTRHPGRPIAEIATAVGYRHHQTLDRVFRQATGRSPSDYRRAAFSQRPSSH